MKIILTRYEQINWNIEEDYKRINILLNVDIIKNVSRKLLSPDIIYYFEDI